MKKFVFALLASAASVSVASAGEEKAADTLVEKATDMVVESATDVVAESATDIVADSATEIVAENATDVVAENAGEATAEEAPDMEAQVEARFKEVDVDADGIVTRAEYEADYAKKAEEAATKGEAWDDERRAKAAADFVAMAGEDDAVTLEEAKAFVAARQAAVETEATVDTTGQ